MCNSIGVPSFYILDSNSTTSWRVKSSVCFKQSACQHLKHPPTHNFPLSKYRNQQLCPLHSVIDQMCGGVRVSKVWTTWKKYFQHLLCKTEWNTMNSFEGIICTPLSTSDSSYFVPLCSVRCLQVWPFRTGLNPSYQLICLKNTL